MKRLITIVALVGSGITAHAQLSHVSGRGSSFVIPGAGITLQLVEEPAQNIYDNLQLEVIDEKTALGTLVKKSAAITCAFNSKNEPGSGIFTYSCTVHLGMDGEIQN